MIEKNSVEEEIVWLPSDIAKKVKQSKGHKGLENEIMKYIEDSKLEFQTVIEGIDEDLLVYRAKMIQARNEFKKVKEEELIANYELWEKFQADLEGAKVKSNEIKNAIMPMRDELKQIKSAIDSIDLYKIEQVLGVMQKINNMSTSDIEIFKLILEQKHENK